MSELKNDLFLRALRQQAVPRTPLWLMRQAGRYLPEYREVRQQAGSIVKLFKNPALACEVTLQPLRRFPLDAAIIFSDILTIPDALGLGLYFVEGEGPRLERSVATAAAIQQLPELDVQRDLDYVLEAITRTKTALQQEVPLIGFSGSPWTLASYMVPGGASKHVEIKTLLYRDPEALHRLLDHLTRAVTAYLIEQIHAGVDAVMIFDTWGGVLSASTYEPFSLQYMQAITRAIKATADVPVILFTKGSSAWLGELAASGADAIGIDWTITLEAARAATAGRVALQGNLDPLALHAPPAEIERAVGRILASYGHASGHVFNLGHGIHLSTPPEHVAVLCRALAEQSPAYHQGS